MNLFIILSFIGILIIVIPIILFKKKKKTKNYIPQKITTPLPGPIDESHPNIIIKNNDYQLYENFMDEYNPTKDFKFSELGFRKGARNTCPFGISEGFKYINGKMVWGYVRLHTGVDRAGGGTYKDIPDIVQIPFDFDKSRIYEYKDKNGKWTGYGTLISLINTKYQFEMRIAHMDPLNDIIPWSYDRLKKGLSFKRGWLLGSAGTCGDSSGAHTHTEFLSLDDSCEVFDILLEEQYRDKSLVEYTKNDILKEYRKYKYFKNSSDREILKDWEAVKAYRGAMFVNKYKYKYQISNGTKFTRYASNLLFGGL
jgi:hypothetical protein